MTYPEQVPPPPDPPVPPYQPPYGMPVGPDQPPAYGMPMYYPQPVYPYGYQPYRRTEGMAIASMVVSCTAILALCTYGIGGVLGVVGAILGHVARRRIRRNGTDGDGFALAGIIVGWVLAGVALVLAALVITLVFVDPGSSD